MKIKVGTFVRYKMKNQLGLVGEVTERGARVWYHMGGTRALSPIEIIEAIPVTEAVYCKFENEYAKPSLFERRERLLNGGDTSDLIDYPDIRRSIQEMFNAIKEREDRGEG